MPRSKFVKEYVQDCTSEWREALALAKNELQRLRKRERVVVQEIDRFRALIPKGKSGKGKSTS
jgi:hypothetical protein